MRYGKLTKMLAVTELDSQNLMEKDLHKTKRKIENDNSYVRHILLILIKLVLLPID